MRIAIDARPLTFAPGQRTGIARWARNLVGGLADIDRGNEYLLLCRPGDRTLLAGVGTNFRPVEVMQLGDYSSAAHGDEQLFSAETLEALRPDVYLSLYFVVPLDRSFPAVCVFDDLIPWIVMKGRHDLIPKGQFVGEEMRAFQAWKRLSAHSADAVIAISDSTRRDLVSFWGVEETKIHVVYGGLEPGWATDPRVEEGPPCSLDLPAQYFLYTGTIEPRKNVEGVIAAYGALRRRFDVDTPLVIAGARGQLFDHCCLGAIQREVEPWSFTPELGHHFQHVRLITHFLSRRDQRFLLKRAWALVWPSYYEGFGLPVLEAMALGTPVITAANSSLVEVGGDATLYVDPRQPDQIADAMHRLLVDDALHAELSRRGAARAREFTREAGARHCLEVLTRVAAGGPRARRPAELEGGPAFVEPTREEQAAVVTAVTSTARKGPVLVYGAGAVGKALARALDRSGCRVAGFLDSDPRKWGRQLDAWPIWSFADGLRMDPALIVLGSRSSGGDMKSRLDQLGWPSSRVVGL